MERETGFEPATSTLARLHSTTELFPPGVGSLPTVVPERGSTYSKRAWECQDRHPPPDAGRAGVSGVGLKGVPNVLHFDASRRSHPDRHEIESAGTIPSPPGLEVAGGGPQDSPTLGVSDRLEGIAESCG